jgi:hypothetical protein
VQINVLQWCDAPRDTAVHTVASCPEEAYHSPPFPDSLPGAPGWQPVLRVLGKPSSPSGARCAVLALDWHFSGRVGAAPGGGGGEALLAFAHADGGVGVVDLAPGGRAPAILWGHEVDKDPAGAPVRQWQLPEL